jgi:hypothetical protein
MSLLKPRGLLYHYTTIEGFLGILESDSIRATHIRYMNDSQEFIDALEHTEALVDELVSEFDRCQADFRQALSYTGDLLCGEFEKLRESLRVGLGGFLGSMNSPLSKRNSAYVVSFTDDAAQASTAVSSPGDRLSQWRAYGGGGKGISLGFDHSALYGGRPGEAWNSGGCTAFLLNCLYTQGEKRAALKSVADILMPSFRKFWEASGMTQESLNEHESSYVAFRQQAIFGWVINASTFKNPTFSEEKEWRIVILGPGSKPSTGSKKESELSVRFRSGPLGITPYLQLPLLLSSSSSPLRRIVVGPNPHMQESVKAVEMILEDRGIEIRNEERPNGLEIEPSEIPYRNW